MRTQATLDALCAALQRNCGDQYEACREVGVSLIFVTQWAKDDKVAAERLQEATNVGNMGLVSAAIQRGVRGVEEAVWYKGQEVGTKTVYSDSLLTTLLKAKVPEFHKDADGSGVNVTVNVANVMPRAESYDQWLEMKQQTLTALAAPVPSERDDALKKLGRVMTQPDVNVIEAEYVEVRETAPLPDLL